MMFAPWCPVASSGAFSAEIWVIFQADKTRKHTDSLSRKTDGSVEKRKVKEGGPCCIALARIRGVGWGGGKVELGVGGGGEVNVPHFS